MFRPNPFSLCVALCLFGAAATSHEYWIEAEKPVFEPGGTLTANLKVGENFKGSRQIYAASQYESFVIASGNRIKNIPGKLGDVPAVTMGRMPEGLAVIAMVSSYSRIDYTEFEKFENFAKAHGNDNALSNHEARGLSKENVAETYRRFSKALVPVGNGAGNDIRFGMELELTAKQNPYAAKETITYQLTRDRVPLASQQVDVFHRAKLGEDASKTELITDANGNVEVPVRLGQTLVSAVALEEPAAELAAERDVVWYSLWASSTFWIQ